MNYPHPIPHGRYLAPLPVIRCGGCSAAREYARHGARSALGSAGKLLALYGFDVARAAAHIADFEGQFWNGVRVHLARAAGGEPS